MFELKSERNSLERFFNEKIQEYNNVFTDEKKERLANRRNKLSKTLAKKRRQIKKAVGEILFRKGKRDTDYRAHEVYGQYTRNIEKDTGLYKMIEIAFKMKETYENMEVVSVSRNYEKLLVSYFDPEQGTHHGKLFWLSDLKLRADHFIVVGERELYLSMLETQFLMNVCDEIDRYCEQVIRSV